MSAAPRPSNLPPLVLVLLLLAAVLPLRFMGTGPNPPPPEDPPVRAGLVVLPYLQLPTPTGISVMWETKQKLPGRVEYGTTRSLGQNVGVEEPRELHEVRLEGLRPATTYYYRVRSGGLASEVYRFRTAPPPGTKRWRMALYGDSRSNPPTHRRVAELMAQARPDLIVHTGDIVGNGKDHDSWRREFFEPLGELARAVPWVSTIGNHENDAANYFSYAALPGNEHYFSLEFANADLICLDSNAWIEKGRDSRQFRWLTDHLAGPRRATWTFVVFHQPLFSAHAARPISGLRWDWAPLLLDPANRVDAVLTGHDHFYARNYRMGRLAETEQPGVLFLTSAGGGAGLYRSKARDYVAREKSTHHFVLFDFDGDRATVTATDIAGREVDRFVLTKDPTPAEEFCAYEVEELRQMLRLALTGARPVRLPEGEAGTIDTSLRVPADFTVPVSGRFEWQSVPGWSLPRPTTPFRVEPGEPLIIPLQAEVAAGPFRQNPSLTIRFDAGRFRNRVVDLAPFQLAGPEAITARRLAAAPAVDGRLDEKAWESAEGHALLGLPPRGGRADRVRFLADRDWVYVGLRADDPAARARVKTVATQGSSRLALTVEHVRLVLADGQQTRTFVVTPGQVRFSSGGEEGTEDWWRGAAAPAEAGWAVEMAVPRRSFADWSRVRVNVAHRREDGTELHLCPSYKMGTDPDRLPDVQPADVVERFARLVVE